jgi:hypothetical protein
MTTLTSTQLDGLEDDELIWLALHGVQSNLLTKELANRLSDVIDQLEKTKTELKDAQRLRA